jgi:hypothetical protein
MSGLHDDRCATIKGRPCNCALAALAPVRSEPLLAAIDRLQAQFAGYALRVAPSDSGNDIILGTIDEIRRIAANNMLSVSGERKETDDNK